MKQNKKETVIGLLLLPVGFTIAMTIIQFPVSLMREIIGRFHNPMIMYIIIYGGVILTGTVIMVSCILFARVLTRKLVTILE